MIAIARTRDLALVRSILTHPTQYGFAGDDSSPAPEAFRPNDDPRIWYVTASDERGAFALFTLLPENAVCWQVHAAALPRAWGALTRPAARLLVEFVFRETGCRRIVATIARFNRLAIRLAEDAGLVRYGMNPKSFLKHGSLCDQILFGVSKPETL